MSARRTARDERTTARRAAGDEREPHEDRAREDEEDVIEASAPRRDRETERRERQRHRREGSGRMSAAAAARAAARGIVELTGKQPEGVTAVEPAEDGWIVSVEVLEDQRVPSSGDILATYEAELDTDGTLVSYRRTKRYSRGRGYGNGES